MLRSDQEDESAFVQIGEVSASISQRLRARLSSPLLIDDLNSSGYSTTARPASPSKLPSATSDPHAADEIGRSLGDEIRNLISP